MSNGEVVIDLYPQAVSLLSLFHAFVFHASPVSIDALLEWTPDTEK